MSEPRHNRTDASMALIVVAVAVLIVWILLPARGQATPTIVRIHDCPTATQWGDEVDVDFWC